MDKSIKTKLKNYLQYKPRTKEEIVDKFGSDIIPLLQDNDFEYIQQFNKQVFQIKDYENYHVKDFSNITSINDLIYYLRKTSVDHMNKYVSTCTSATRLKQILDGKKWYVNNPSKMNDAFEYNAFKEEGWSHKYFISFSEGQDESIAMWSMYGQPWTDGIMISIPSAILKKWEGEIRNKRKYYLVKDETLSERKEPLFVEINRVVYFNEKKHTLETNKRENHNFPEPYKEEDLAGFVKDAAWKYENEYRLLINTPATHDSKTIAVDIPDYVISSMVITTSPRFEGELEVSGVKEIINSRFAGKLQYVYCDKCNHRNRELNNI